MEPDAIQVDVAALKVRDGFKQRVRVDDSWYRIELVNTQFPAVRRYCCSHLEHPKEVYMRQLATVARQYYPELSIDVPVGHDRHFHRSKSKDEQRVVFRIHLFAGSRTSDSH